MLNIWLKSWDYEFQITGEKDSKTTLSSPSMLMHVTIVHVDGEREILQMAAEKVTLSDWTGLAGPMYNNVAV